MPEADGNSYPVEDLSFVETDTHEGIALDVGYAGDNYIDYFLLFGMM